MPIHPTRPQPRRTLRWQHAVLALVLGTAAYALIGRPGLRDTRADTSADTDAGIVLYGTASCPYCAEARAWLHGQGYAFKDCDVQHDPQCSAEFQSYGGRGVPLLAVRGQPLGQGGFDPDALLAALRR